MPVATPETYAAMLDKAKSESFAFPAINVSSSQTLNAALAGFAEAEFRQIADWIVEVVDGLAANGADGNAEVEEKVKAEVSALCARFPLYADM